MRAETRYARSGQVAIGYQVVGEGPVALVSVPGRLSHVELAWELPDLARGSEWLASCSRLMLCDKRGTGISDPLPASELPTLEQRSDDLRTVMDAAGSERAAIFGASEGGCMRFATTYPERAIALATFGCFAKRVWSLDSPGAPTPEERRRAFDELERDWTAGLGWEEVAPSLGPAELAELAGYDRRCASPGAAVALPKMTTDVDVRDVLPSIPLPTVVMRRAGDRDVGVEEARYVAVRIPGARLVELPGADQAWWTQDRDAILDEAEALAGVRPAPQPTRQLATVLFTDVVGPASGSRRRATGALGDVLARHHQAVRRELARHRGVELDTAGDGLFARFDGPARAIRCACAIREAVAELGLEVRAGVHTGECELLDGKVAGIAVHRGARVAALAQPGEVLVTSAVKDLASGSGIAFEDGGEHELKGLPERRRPYAVTDA